MLNSAAVKAIAECADPARARRGMLRLSQSEAASALKRISPESARILGAVLAGSQFLTDVLLGCPAWLEELLQPDFLRHPRRAEGLQRQAQKIREMEVSAIPGELRLFKRKEMLRIGARDLAKLANALEITRELSDVADAVLATVCQTALEEMTRRFGQPFHLDANDQWLPTQFSVLGLGKLGGQELNYSSDVDVLFVYSEEGYVFKAPPKKGQRAAGLTSHQFFTRVAEKWLAEMQRLTADGALYRVDLRLRPEGGAGPLVRSLDSYENYYAQWGQTWERMMLIKARPVAGDHSLGGEFLEMVQPFRYARSLSPRALGEVAAVKKRIETEVVKQGELERNVKLGRGGIREIEFVVQTLQILNAGRMPFLQGAATIPVLHKLVDYALVAAEEAHQLERAYLFLRDVEHRLQMEADLQTHTIPLERSARERLARLMGFSALPAFEKALRGHSVNVRKIFEETVEMADSSGRSDLPDDSDEDRWLELLAEHSFRDAQRALEMAKIFLHGPGFVHVSPRTEELARELFSRFLTLSRNPALRLSDPDRTLVRLNSFIDSYGARAALYEMWTHNPSLFELLLLLFDRSEFLAETAISVPDLVDELETSGRLRRQKPALEILDDLRQGAGDSNQSAWLKRYHEAELMRLGLRDILGLADYEQTITGLSALAQACLQYGIEIVMRETRRKASPFCIIGLGKLGGEELTYGSDLDLVFVADAPVKTLPALQKFATRLIELLTPVYSLDARLRPDGEKGLLVNTFDAFEKYYRSRAGLWEIQALTRARFVAGDAETGKRFEQLAIRLTEFSTRPGGWKQEIAAMRARIAVERTPKNMEAQAIKTGIGGLMDAEFLAQAFNLQSHVHEPNTLRALEQGVSLGLIGRRSGDALLQNYVKLRRIEGILRRWSGKGEVLLPSDEPALNRVAVRCGYENAEVFAKAIATMRKNIHEAWKQYFPKIAL